MSRPADRYAGRQGTINLATCSSTGKPSWFTVVVLIRTTPRSGRFCDTWTSMTSDSTWSVSPARTGRGRRHLLDAGADQSARDSQLALDQQSHGEARGLPAAGHQFSEETRGGGLSSRWKG